MASVPVAHFPTAAGGDAGRWAPDGKGNGHHFTGAAAGGVNRDDKKAAKAAEKANKAAEKAKKEHAKILKQVIKEGGKKGVEIAGAADMGGLDFFCSNMQFPGGDIEMLIASMDAMNKEIDPEDEEAKGGSGEVGKMIFSGTDECDDAKCVAVAHVPASKTHIINAKEWMTEVMSHYSPTAVLYGECTATRACMVITMDSAQGRFILKDKDSMLPVAREYLKSKNAIPQKEQADDDDMEWMNDCEDEIEW